MSKEYNPEDKNLISTEVFVRKGLEESFIKSAEKAGAEILKKEKVGEGVEITYTPDKFEEKK